MSNMKDCNPLVYNKNLDKINLSLHRNKKETSKMARV